MKAIVCVKQVPDTSGKVAVKADGTMDRASMATITNPDDMNAIEAALKLKDETGCEVTVVSMGPPPAEGMLRELLAMGADKAVLVSGREFGGSDTYATSQILAAALKKIGVDDETIVFCGRQAIDGDTAQVGPQIAEKLNLPQVTYVSEIKAEGKKITVQRMLEDGYMTIEVALPCLLTCIKELNDCLELCILLQFLRLFSFRYLEIGKLCRRLQRMMLTKRHRNWEQNGMSSGRESEILLLT